MESTTTYFLHGLESSGQGTKGRFLTKLFPQLIAPDFHGTLKSRLLQLENELRDKQKVILIGSSFGGLMATCYAIQRQIKVARLILLAPALNFESYQPPKEPLPVPTHLIIGEHDEVTPPQLVIPLARRSFSDLTLRLENDDHMLHKTYHKLDWQQLLAR